MTRNRGHFDLEGIASTVVNGTGLIEYGEHTVALPGRVHHNALYA